MSGFVKKSKQEKINNKKSSLFMNPSLDLGLANNLISGCSICIQEKDNFNFSNTFLRYFISAGYHQKEKTLVLTGNNNHLKRTIPNIMESKKIKELNKKKTINSLEKNNNSKNIIAWRYENQKTDINKESIFNNIYNQEYKSTDISKSVKIEDLENKIIFKNIFDFNSYNEILEFIQEFYENNLTSPDDTTNFRIVIKDLDYTELCKNKDFNIFLHNLKVFNRYSNTYILFSINSYLLNNNNYFNYFDFVYEIVGFKENWDFIDFKGFIKILKSSCLNKFQQLKRANLSLGIKMNKSELWLEELYETQRELLDLKKTEKPEKMINN